MIEDFELINLSKEEKEEIKNILEYDYLLALACSYNQVNKNIELFKSLNIKLIKDLIIYNYTIFLEDTEKLTKRFSKFNIPALANLINEDYTTIEEIYE